MTDRPEPRGPGRRLIGICFKPRDQFRNRIRRNAGLGEDHVCVGRQESDWLEILQEIEGQIVNCAVKHIGAEMTDADGVAIRRGTN